MLLQYNSNLSDGQGHSGLFENQALEVIHVANSNIVSEYR